ncbi:MAG TPA: bifunctional (p)ppGpp synthetase/guanosine-3',5'-bis(diphosphate) 3'-pyrophosphohydrolase [Candidatus Baltobacteraceae bacterium]|nr:bifunctional (p)ppGpp synthetase/guanosine-3',5'-bis(diphosphate) 3'-pyrophosphohydrolase [Candidatus Baltobacteraceae bacterium]
MMSTVPSHDWLEGESASPTADAVAQLGSTWDDLREVIQRQMHGMDLTLVRRAYDFAEAAHEGKLRRSGEPYISHPTAVAIILAEIQLDQEALAAALLHDVIEDTDVTMEQLQKAFGERVAKLVDGVTKLGRIRWTTEEDQAVREKERQAESLRKMFLAMVDDVRVVLIKLADRLHNMRTLEHMPRAKQLRSALETLEIYAPLSNRLGIWQFKSELEDLALRYVDPQTYFSIVRALERRGVDRERYLNRVIDELNTTLREADISAEISGREKHITSIVRKMERKGRSFDEIYDVLGVRIIVNEKKDCYGALGVIHSIWHPIPGEFDDYIATPKEGVYQSIHTAVLGPEGHPLEIQIRTQEMHHIAEFGIAAHWRYKEGAKPDPHVEAKVAWLRQLMDWRDEVVDAQEFVESLKSDVFQEMLYVFTPKGDIIELPAGATPVDFAYRIHTEVGHQCVGAKINGHLVPLNYKLQNGEVIQIMTSKSKVGPSRDWLQSSSGYITTASAREKVRQWFRRQQRDENISQGRDTLERELRRLGVEAKLEDVAKHFPLYQKVDDFLAAIGYGAVTPQQISTRLAEHEDREAQNTTSAPTTPKLPPSLQVTGVGDLYTRLASCCKPVYGDSIIGYVTRGRGITVHRADCHNVIHVDDPDRLVQVSWGNEQKQRYPVSIRLEAWDRVGLLRDVTTLVADEKISMLTVLTSVNDDRTVDVLMTVEVEGVKQLSRLLQKLESIRDVYDVRRETTQNMSAKGPDGKFNA